MWSNFWKDLLVEDLWMFPEVAPWQIQKSIGYPVIDHSERLRAEWMWRRRPKAFLGDNAFSYVLIIAVSILLSLIPVAGSFLGAVWLAGSFLLAALDVVRNVRWRRDYETTLCRMIRTMQSRGSI